MTVTKNLIAAVAILCGTLGVAVAQTSNDRLAAAGEATRTQVDTRDTSVKNSNRKTPAQIEVENGNKAAPQRRAPDMSQTAPLDERPSYDGDQAPPQDDTSPRPYRN